MNLFVLIHTPPQYCKEKVEHPSKIDTSGTKGFVYDSGVSLTQRLGY